ncbi:MAG: 50S ribosomal protein L20 [Planctomycetota bacterium]|jgi:large subunit ribosomal protein L20
MRVKTAVPRHRRIKRLKKAAKGFRGGRRKLLRTVKDAVQRSRAHAYVGRKQRKREFRSLWIMRINAACRMRGMKYSTFMAGITSKGVGLDRKALAHLAMHDSAGFDAVVNLVRE